MKKQKGQDGGREKDVLVYLRCKADREEMNVRTNILVLIQRFDSKGRSGERGSLVEIGTVVTKSA